MHNLKKIIINESIYNDERNQEGIDDIDQNIMNFISAIKKFHTNPNIGNDLNTYHDLSSLSQEYVFYKLSQTQLFNNHHLRSMLQYHDHGICPFIKDRIKYYLITQEIFNSKSRHKKINKS
ncbi:unnamed protein product [Musa acuminata subsp. malaccensis]|uniref:(wild Malaysian banana) hypothetical protein n=1 Tax=Musa acuminata subsp. malaccensis TaxID=214687 RepID=A0A8D7F6D8_MUSAM|nr:unnamed protein product [Musa acuminata subsp. malaccensis]